MLLLASCGAEREKPDDEPAAELVPAREPEERAFDARLAAIHDEWLGTEWAFSGTTRTPRGGAIACGYFVTTTLQQAGVELDRVRLAQAASETMIVELAKPETVRRFSDAPLDAFLASVRRQGEGYYIVGLDDHTGFLRVAEDGVITFVHSGPGKGVVIEAPGDAPKLANSRYRVTGKIGPPAPP